MFARIERIIIAAMFALLAAGITLIVVSAQGPTPPPAATATTETPVTAASAGTCGVCHQDIADTWAHGPHAQALSDPVFDASWESQGKPGACLVCHTTGYDPATGQSENEGVTCIACHNPVPANHPKEDQCRWTNLRICAANVTVIPASRRKTGS